MLTVLYLEKKKTFSAHVTLIISMRFGLKLDMGSAGEITEINEAYRGELDDRMLTAAICRVISK